MRESDVVGGGDTRRLVIDPPAAWLPDDMGGSPLDPPVTFPLCWDEIVGTRVELEGGPGVGTPLIETQVPVDRVPAGWLATVADWTNVYVARSLSVPAGDSDTAITVGSVAPAAAGVGLPTSVVVPLATEAQGEGEGEGGPEGVQVFVTRRNPASPLDRIVHEVSIISTGPPPCGATPVPVDVDCGGSDHCVVVSSTSLCRGVNASGGLSLIVEPVLRLRDGGGFSADGDASIVKRGGATVDPQLCMAVSPAYECVTDTEPSVQWVLPVDFAGSIDALDLYVKTGLDDASLRWPWTNVVDEPATLISVPLEPVPFHQYDVSLPGDLGTVRLEPTNDWEEHLLDEDN